MENEIMTKITSTLYSFIWNSNIFSQKNLGVLLEPINTLIKLALLKHYNYGTKISIQNNIIIFQQPNSVQGLTRWSNGDKYEDLHNLVNPIKKFISSKSKNNIWTQNNFIYICEQAIEGLKKLSQTYENNKIANHTIEFYKSLIEENLKNNSHFLDKIDIPNGMFDIYEEFFSDWENNEIDVLVLLLKNIDLCHKKEIKDSYIKAIEDIINAKDLRMKRVIEKVQSGTV